MKMFYRVYIMLNADTNEQIKFGFDFDSEFDAIKFATMAFMAETAYDRIYVELLEYDEKAMITTDAPCWRDIKT